MMQFSRPVMAQSSEIALQQQIQDTLAKYAGVYAVAFKDLQTGKQVLINAQETFHAASTMKVPVMIEVFRQAAAGHFTLEDTVPVKNEFKSIADSSIYHLSREDDSQQELYRQIGARRTLYALMYEMIIMSSNLATNIIIEKVGAENVTQTAHALGAPHIQVLRGVEDEKAFEKGWNNTTTAYDLLVLFEKIAEGRAVSADASQAMIKILLDQHFNNVIPAHLPPEVKVAHKTGEITGVRHDAGIVFLPDGRKYVLVLLSKQLPDIAQGVQAMANVSAIVYRYMQGK
ncbi:MAG TPA: serine hydrolase [Chitinophaga sp.]|uniref:serine hydrolase n=1 Tax=Chitinophaga sp. TaxID=1869181 RepID=UPI002DBFF1D7|nr:serine hydrolase [Chitinophaga sp.]HEU4555854.1 serine hydrolase [Chitinophaga sp.]